MTNPQKLQSELDRCIQIAANPGTRGEQRRKAMHRAETIAAERMTITTDLAFAGAQAELQRMICAGKGA